MSWTFVSLYHTSEVIDHNKANWIGIFNLCVGLFAKTEIDVVACPGTKIDLLTMSKGTG